MYDTTSLWLPNELIKDSGYLNRVPTLLTNTKETYKNDTRELYFTGSILGMSASISNAGISLKGSICKSYLEDNFKTLTRQDTHQAIELIEDTLKIPVSQADLKRIDFAQSFAVSQDPKSFFMFLGDSQFYRREPVDKTLYYRNSLRTKLFYNKIAEGKAKGQIIPQIWLDKHILRYELRYTSRLPKQFNRSQIQAKDLYSESFYMDMVDRWILEWQNITKNSIINFNLDNMDSPKDFFNQMALLKIKEIGQNNALQMVEQLKAKNQFKQKEYYSRLKADIKKLCKTDGITEDSSIINELDKKIMKVKEYYR